MWSPIVEGLNDEIVFYSRGRCMRRDCKLHECHTNLMKEYKWKKYEACKHFVSNEQLIELGWNEWFKTHERDINE